MELRAEAYVCTSLSLGTQERSLRSAAPSYIICILLQVVMQVIAMHSQTPTLKNQGSAGIHNRDASIREHTVSV